VISIEIVRCVNAAMKAGLYLGRVSVFWERREI
jgi:hypothetical protein